MHFPGIYWYLCQLSVICSDCNVISICGLYVYDVYKLRPHKHGLSQVVTFTI